MTEWKAIPRFAGYEVSSDGQVRSLDRWVAGRQRSKRKIKGQVLKAFMNPNGYLMVSLWKENKKRNVWVHRVVGLTFIGSCQKFDHKDQVKTHNHVSNLRACTHSQNLANTKSRGGSSQFKGVSWRQLREKWVAYITVRGKRKHLGYFDCEINAAKAYNKAATEHFEEFACVNEV